MLYVIPCFSNTGIGFESPKRLTETEKYNGKEIYVVVPTLKKKYKLINIWQKHFLREVDRNDTIRVSIKEYESDFELPNYVDIKISQYKKDANILKNINIDKCLKDGNCNWTIRRMLESTEFRGMSVNNIQSVTGLIVLGNSEENRQRRILAYFKGEAVEEFQLHLRDDETIINVKRNHL